MKIPYINTIVTGTAIAGALLLIQCKKKQSAEACFAPSSKAVIPGQVDTFTNCSVDASTFFWDFGDTTNSSEKSPVKSFKNKGTYKVQLAVNNGSLQRTTFQNILVGDPFIAKIILDKVSLFGDTVKLTKIKLHVAPYQSATLDTTLSGSVTFPLNISLGNMLLPMTPGRNLSITVTAVSSVGNKQAEVDVVPGIQPNAVHGTDASGNVVLDVLRKVQ
jgi:PKD repeat protein